MNYYEKSALLFSNENNPFMAYNLFIKAIEIDNENSMLWYGLGNSLFKTSQLANDSALFEKAIACLKRSLKTDTGNTYTLKALGWLTAHMGVPHEKIQAIETMPSEGLNSLKTPLSDTELIKSFKGFKNIDNQISLVMYLGETKDNDYFGLLKHCILEETDIHIIFAALKRIHYFKDTENLEPVFTEIIRKGNNAFEPYFSIALSNIDKEWASVLLSKYGTDIIADAQEHTKNDIPVTDEGKAIVVISFANLPLNEIEKLYTDRNDKILVFHLTSGLNDEGIAVIIKSGLATKTGKLTLAGWDYINEYITIRKSTETPASEATQSGKRKWWQFRK